MSYVDSTQRFVSGAVRVKMYRGSLAVTGRRSQHSLYSPALATYGAGDLFDHAAAVGFINIYGLQLRTQAQLQLGGSSPRDSMRQIGQPSGEAAGSGD
jgi:argininosuccinate synthase